jgi:hypothetical protein
VVPLRPAKGSRTNTGCHGPIDLDADHGEGVGSRWSLTNDDSAPYCADADAPMPVGTIMVITPNTDPPKSDRLRCKAQWAAGRWTLIAARPLTTAPLKPPRPTRYSPGERSRETLSRLFPSGATDRGDFRLSSVRFAVAVFSNRVGRRSNPGIV